MGLPESNSIRFPRSGCERRSREPDAGALRIEQSVDQVKVAWAVAACAHRQFARDARFTSRSKCRSLLVADMYPFDRGIAQGIGEAVEGITGTP